MKGRLHFGERKVLFLSDAVWLLTLRFFAEVALLVGELFGEANEKPPIRLLLFSTLSPLGDSEFSTSPPEPGAEKKASLQEEDNQIQKLFQIQLSWRKKTYNRQ